MSLRLGLAGTRPHGRRHRLLPLLCAAQEGKRAEELAGALPPRLRHSLLYAVESSGLK